MDRKKIAVFTSGWSGEILYQYIMGVNEGLKDMPADIYMFASNAIFGTSTSLNYGEMNIFQLPNLKDFDAALIFANGIDNAEVLDNINRRCDEAGIPVVYTGKEDAGHYFAGTDNSVGTKILCRHIIEEHGAKDIWFIAGSLENMDSNDRMKAVREELEAHGLELKEENICYSSWSPYLAYTYVINRINNGDKLPDAIICANDTLAMVICKELALRNINVPNDVIITGFDNESLAQLYDPAICSVDQRFDKIGIESVNIIKSVFAGEQTDRVHRVACEFIPSESCGCSSAKDFDKIRRKIGKDKFEERLFNSNFDLKLTAIEREVLKKNDIGSLREVFTYLNDNDVQYEGNTFHILIDPLVEETITENQRELRKDGYPEFMNILYSKDKGKVLSDKTFETRKMVPYVEEGENRFLVFMPIHEGDYEIGYIVFGDDFSKMKDSPLLRKYMERFNIIINRFLQKLRLNALNSRLMQMTETDAMTHVKNRTAFENRLADLQSKLTSEKKPRFALAVFDINNLKTINDSLGHEAGDEYIINSCRLICKTFKKSAVYRIGGDEFVALLEGDDYDSREKLFADMHEKIEQFKNSDMPLTEKVSIASGIAVYDENVDGHISDVFKRADAAMYENKAIMKAGNK